MKKYLYLSGLMLTAIAFVACSDGNGDGGSYANFNNLNVTSVVASSSNIKNAKTLAVGRKNGTLKTRAAGDVTTVNTLLKVSDDMKFIEVNYTFDVEVALKDENGKNILVDGSDEENPEVQTIIERVNSSIKISPNFIFNVGEDYLWLSNCFYEIPGYSEMEESPVKKILTQIRDGYNEAHHNVHGGQYLIRKSDGALFEWSIADGAPNDLNDGYNPQSMLNGWLHAVGNHIYVREGGYEIDHYHPSGRVLCITDRGSELSYEQIIPAEVDGYDVAHILPAGNNLGVVCREKNTKFPVPYIYNTSTKTLKRLTGIDVDENTRWSLITIAGEFYAVRNHHHPDGVDEPNSLGFYRVNTNDATVGERVYEEVISIGVSFDDDKFFAKGFATTESTFKFILNDDGQNPPVRIMCTFNPKATGEGKFTKRNIPSYYPGSINAYIEGIGCGNVTKDGFYVCDITKDEGEWVSLDWSDAAQYQNLERKYVHFEAANMSIKYEATTKNGDNIALWVPIVGENRGKVAVYSDANGGSYDIDVMVDL